MGRPWREELKGGIYHVIARGNNKEYIFREGIDKGYFIKLLKTYQGTMLYRVFGYVLMDNHYHLIIQTHGEKLQKDFMESMSNYRIIMEEEEETDFDSLDSIGEEAYQIMCKSRKHVDARKRLDEVLIETGTSKVDYDLIKKSSRKRHLTEYQLKYIQAALELKYTFREIAENIGITESAVKDILMRLT